MSISKNLYKLKSKIMVYPGMNAWRFLVVAEKESKAIKEKFGKSAKGWGSIKVIAKIGKTDWDTSIFPDKKSGTYLLPLKLKIRKIEDIYDDDVVEFSLKII